MRQPITSPLREVAQVPPFIAQKMDTASFNLNPALDARFIGFDAPPTQEQIRAFTQPSATPPNNQSTTRDKRILMNTAIPPTENKLTGFSATIGLGDASDNSKLMIVGAIIVAVIATLGIQAALKPKRRRR